MPQMGYEKIPLQYHVTTEIESCYDTANSQAPSGFNQQKETRNEFVAANNDRCKHFGLY